MKLKKTAAKLFAGTLFLFTSAALSAHPHVWIDFGAQLQLSEKALEGVWIEWSFDEFMSSMVMADLDANKDGVISSAESARIHDSYFSSLKDFNFFSYLYWNDKRLPLPAPTNFTASIRDKKLFYRFFLALNLPLLGPKGVLRVSQYDEEFYTDMGVRKTSPSLVSAPKKWKVGTLVRVNEKLTYYSGQINPQEIIFSIEP